MKCAQQEKPYYSEHVGNSMSPVLGTSQLGGVKNYGPGGRLGGDIFGGVDSSIAERKSPLWVTNSIVGGVLLENLDCKLLADMLRIANNKAGKTASGGEAEPVPEITAKSNQGFLSCGSIRNLTCRRHDNSDRPRRWETHRYG